MRAEQLQLDVYKGKWGGRRPGSGRKRIHSNGVGHRPREKITKRTPLHINFKYRTSIRNKFCLKLLKKAILNSQAHGMRSLTVTIAKGLNSGKVQLERYHLHVLRTLRETKNAVVYVLFNKQKHEKGTYSKIDEYSSLLYLKNALKLISEFSKICKMTIVVPKLEDGFLDKEKTYLLSRALN